MLYIVPTIYKTPTIYNTGDNGGGGGGEDLPEGYERLLSITNGTGNEPAIYLNNLSLPLILKTSDCVKFEITFSTNFSSNNPEMILINQYPVRYLGFLLDFNYWYITNSPLYQNTQRAIEYISKGSSYIIEQEGGKIRINGNEYLISSGEEDNEQTINQIFVMAGNLPKKIYIHGVIVKDKDGNLKYNLIPARNNNTGKKGLFESVSQTFLELSNYQN